MDPRLKKGIEEFNQGNFFEAHEIWEGLWQELKSPEKESFQGIIQASVTLHLIEENRLVGAKKVWQRALENFKKAEAEIFGINIEELKQQIEKIFSDLEASKPLNVKVII